jgi:hypothetical protein
MLPAVSIVTLSCYPDLFCGLAASLHEPAARKIVVTSGAARPDVAEWLALPGIEPFCFARNANIGIRAAGRDDVLLVNDDVRFMLPETSHVLRRVAHRREAVGILSPRIVGEVGNPLQADPPKGTLLHISRKRLAFVCVYIKRAVFDAVGLLDERFTGYGCEDRDFCRRAQEAGFKLAVTRRLDVLHLSSQSFRRAMTEGGRLASADRMRELYRTKWESRS